MKERMNPVIELAKVSTRIEFSIPSAYFDETWEHAKPVMDALKKLEHDGDINLIIVDRVINDEVTVIAEGIQ